MTARTLLVLALIGCEPGDPDGDGDGFPASEDCDDDDPAVNPDADEVCGDGVDNDCDDKTDDPSAIDVITVYLDEDEDGFGVERKDLDGDGELDPTVLKACKAQFRYADQKGDCDDDDPSKFPGTGCP